MDKAREVFQTALEFFGDGEEEVEKAQGVFGAFARMETRLREYERARTIYKVGSGGLGVGGGGLVGLMLVALDLVRFGKTSSIEIGQS